MKVAFMYFAGPRRDTFKERMEKLGKALRDWEFFYADFGNKLEFVLSPKSPGDPLNCVRVGVEEPEREGFNYAAVRLESIQRRALDIERELELYDLGLLERGDIYRWAGQLVRSIGDYITKYTDLSGKIGSVIEDICTAQVYGSALGFDSDGW
jgi:hypothetical protein